MPTNAASTQLVPSRRTVTKAAAGTGKRVAAGNAGTKRAGVKTAAKKPAEKITPEARSRRAASAAVVRKRGTMVLRSSDPQARRASSRLVNVVEPAIKDGQTVSVVVAGQSVVLPAPFAAALYQAASEQAAGHRVTISFPDAVEELTPNQAAAELGISRPLLVRLLDDGTIPYRRLPGSRHRKVARADLGAYQAKKSTRRQRIAEAMNDVAAAGEYLPK